jgi:hypothetical protein
MTFISEFHDMMPHTVTVTATTWNKAGDMVPGSATTHKCYVQGKAQKVVGPDGTDHLTSHIIYLGEYLNVPLNTLVTLPAQFQPRVNVKVLAIDFHSDEDGTEYSIFYCK